MTLSSIFPQASAAPNDVAAASQLSFDSPTATSHPTPIITPFIATTVAGVTSVSVQHDVQALIDGPGASIANDRQQSTPSVPRGVKRKRSVSRDTTVTLGLFGKVPDSCDALAKRATSGK